MGYFSTVMPGTQTLSFSWECDMGYFSTVMPGTQTLVIFSREKDEVKEGKSNQKNPSIFLATYWNFS
jgi:hypothetical protein